MYTRQRYPAKLLIPVVDVPASPERKCNIHDTALQPINPNNIILTSLVLVHAGYLFCNCHPLNINYYGTTFYGMPGSFNSSQINVCAVRIGVLGPRFIVSSEGLGLHKMLPRGNSNPAPPACQASTVPLGQSFPQTRTLLKLVTLGQKSRSQLLIINLFFHNSLLTPLLFISALLCPVEMKFYMLLRYGSRSKVNV